MLKSFVTAALLCLAPLAAKGHVLRSNEESIAANIFENNNVLEGAEANDVNFDEIAVNAYKYGYPLMMEATTSLLFMLSEPTASYNEFFHRRSFPPPSDRSVVRQNLDTLYSTAFLDLTDGPLELDIPATPEGQFYLFQIMDAWTNVIANPGARTFGHVQQKHLIVGPKGIPIDLNLDDYASVIESPTNLLWIIVRTLVLDGDFESVWAIQDQYQLTPLLSTNANTLSKKLFPSTYDPRLAAFKGETPRAILAPLVNEIKSLLQTQPQQTASGESPSPPELVAQLKGVTYFKILSVLMCRNPQLEGDDDVLETFRAIGFRPCRPFNPPRKYAVLKAIKDAPATAQQFVKEGSMNLGDLTTTGWKIILGNMGRFGTDYDLRAIVAYGMIGANLPEDAVYPQTCSGPGRVQLEGENYYKIYFDGNLLPPVEAFWSVTMYDMDGYFIENSLNRYKLSSAASTPPLRFETDGSVTLYLGPDAPANEDDKSNWLPSKAGVDYCLTMRLYSPEEEILNLEWVPPVIESNDDQTS